MLISQFLAKCSTDSDSELGIRREDPEDAGVRQQAYQDLREGGETIDYHDHHA